MYDVIIIGGGFYGCMIALHLSKTYKKVLIIEKEPEILLKASANNQARVHNGYHYPRNYLTALSSHKNYARFIADFQPTVSDKYRMVYAIAKGSKTKTREFTDLYKAIKAPLRVAPKKIKNLLNPDLIEEVFMVEERVFDANRLRTILEARLLLSNIRVLYKTEVKAVKQGIVCLDEKQLSAKRIINCTYSGTNTLLENSGLPALPLKNESTTMPLVQVPGQLKGLGITIMDGEFFSLMPFPSRRLHSLHHVKYTPESGNNYAVIMEDAIRFIPLLSQAVYRDQIKEVKTVLTQNELDDGRPILFKKDYYFLNFDVVLGGKLDNVYDILDKLDEKPAENLNILS